MSGDAVDWIVNPAGKATEEATEAAVEGVTGDAELAELAGGIASPSTGLDDLAPPVATNVMTPAPTATDDLSTLINAPPAEMPSMDDEEIKRIEGQQVKRRLLDQRGRASTFLTGGRKRTLG